MIADERTQYNYYKPFKGSWYRLRTKHGTWLYKFGKKYISIRTPSGRTGVIPMENVVQSVQGVLDYLNANARSFME